jgi:hypothetical protein
MDASESQKNVSLDSPLASALLSHLREYYPQNDNKLSSFRLDSDNSDNSEYKEGSD